MNHPLHLVLATSLYLLGHGCTSYLPPTHAGANPPRGFTSLFNGKDLSGWWGAETEDPRKYLALSPDAFTTKHDASLDNIRAHWRAENDELINDGEGLYL